MKFNLLNDYLQENGFSDSFQFLSDDDTFGHLYIDGKIYPVYLSVSANIPDDLCNSVVIDGKRYRFSADSIAIDKCIYMNLLQDYLHDTGKKARIQVKDGISVMTLTDRNGKKEQFPVCHEDNRADNPDEKIPEKLKNYITVWNFSDGCKETDFYFDPAQYPTTYGI